MGDFFKVKVKFHTFPWLVASVYEENIMQEQDKELIRKTLLGLIWIIFTSYTIQKAPLDKPSTWSIVGKLLTLRWGELNPIIPIIFCLMGVWPMIYAGLMFADGRMQNLRAFPYFLGSNFTGVLTLLPYFLLRQRNQEFYGEKDDWLDLVDRQSTGQTLLVITIILLAWAIVAGDWEDYWYQFQTEPFVQLISLDFCLMCLAFPLTSLFDDDLARRGIQDSRVFWAVASVPLFGPLVYLCLRPELEETSVEAS